MTLNIKVFYTRKEYALLEKKFNKAVLLLDTMLNHIEDKNVKALYIKAIKEMHELR